MNFGFWPFSAKPQPILYKVWLENDGKPLPQGYLRDLEDNRPKGYAVAHWTSAADTQALLAKYQSQFPLIHEYFWASSTVPGMRSDMLRYLLIYDRGGLYADHDVEWSRKRLPSGYDLILWTEFVNSDETVRKNMETTRAYRGEIPEYNVRIANYVFQSRAPRSPLIERGLKLVQERLRINANARLPQYGALYTAGPDAWTDNVVAGLPDPEILQPFEKCETGNVEWTDRGGERVLLLGRQPGRALALHQTHGVWRSAHEYKGKP